MYAQKRAERLVGMPKSRFKRFFFRLHPKRLYKYWFSREGGIMALKVTGAGIVAGFLMLVMIFAYFRKDLPNIRDISGSNIGGSILYYDRTGQTLLFEDVEGSKRIPVKDEQISTFIKQATIAIEDKDFFKHGGFDVRGILRAGVNNAFGKTGTTQGGSTISQQLIRLTQSNVGSERTYTRKIKEIILSVELEREYSKQEILTGYLNTAPYGGIENGVEAAAQNYFHKSAKDLTLDESAMLASIPKSPTYYSPYNKVDFEKDALIGRQHYILDLMEQQGMITRKQRDDAKKVDVLAKVQPRPQHYAGIKSPWFVLTAKEELERRFGAKSVKRGGWKVITTLDMDAQYLAEQQVQKGLAQVRRQGGDTAAFVAEDVKTGQVVALVGGDDFNNKDYGENNYAHDLELPPGSSFKPYDYAALIETQKNVGAGSVLYDSNGAIPGYPCTTGLRGNCVHDYDFRFPGPLSLRYSLGGSRNVPAIKAMLIAGVDQTIDIAHKLMTNYGTDGKPDPTLGTYKCYYDEKNTQEAPCYGSSAIGDGAYMRLDNHVHGYSTLSRNGLNIPQTYIMKITDVAGKTVDEWKPSKGVQAISQDTAYIVSDMMSDGNASYLPSPKPHNYKGWKFGIKTGTTNDGKDGLIMMMSPKYAVGVWVGYHNRQRVMSGFMETMTLPIARGWMQPMHDKITAEQRVKPAGIQTLPAFVVRTHVGVGSIEPSPATDLYPSWYKPPGKATGTNQNVDSVSNKLATECTPQRAIKQVSNADSNTFSVDKFVKGGAGSGTTAEKDDVHKCDDAKPTISIVKNGDGSITATVERGTHSLSSDQFPGTVNFLIDGQIVYTDGVSDGKVTATYSPGADIEDKDVVAQVIDSVLYDGTSGSVHIDAGGGGGGSPLVLAIPSTTGNGINKRTVFNWGGGSPPYNVYRASNNTVLCSSNSTQCDVLYSLAGSGTQVYVKGSNGTSPPSNTETVP